MSREIIVGTRGSKLALIQTDTVIRSLKALYPDIDFISQTIVTAGDRDRHTHLDGIGVDVFVKELEDALLDGRIDIAVHSLKDVPTENPKGLELIAVTERDDPRDVFAGSKPIEKLPAGARVGTGSLRRKIQLKYVRPDLQAYPIRGNIDTRLAKVSSGEIEGAILAAAALVRLGWQDRITQYLPTDSFLPSAGQGALAIEARSADKEIAELVSAIHHSRTWQCISCERAFLNRLGGGCRAPIAALATISGDTLTLAAMVAGSEGQEALWDKRESPVHHAVQTGVELACKMLEAGASDLIAKARAI